ncbi:hypothetical protein BDF14DRAFT_1779102 [Spinellus fusiger]|nr:hypothetical protein BDF14DRAFT_1779102 [Spinellus fusiger]
MHLKDVHWYCVNDEVTLLCAIKETDLDYIKTPLDYPKPFSLAPGNEFLLKQKDVKIQVFESETDDCANGDLFESSKRLLIEISSWFKDLFLIGMKESQDNDITIRGIPPKIFKKVLNYFYTGEIEIKNITDAIMIMDASERLTLTHTLQEARCYLKMRIGQRTIWDIWYISGLYQSTDLENVCINYMRLHIKEAFDHPRWLDTDISMALKALKLDNIEIHFSESVFYDAVILWRKEAIKRTVKMIDDDQFDFELNQDNVMKHLAHLEASQKKVIRANRKSKYSRIRRCIFRDDEDSDEEYEDEKLMKSEISSWKKIFRRSMDLDFENELTDSKGLEDRIQHWKDISKRMIQIDKDFSDMICCIRFPQMTTDYLLTVVEENKDVINVNGIQELLKISYRYHLFQDVNGLKESLRHRYRQ